MATSPREDDIRRISDVGGGISLSDRLQNQRVDGNNTPSSSVAQAIPLFSPSSRPSASTRFRTTARSLTEITTHKPVIRQEDRPTIKKDLQKLRESATTKLSNSFGLLSLDDSDNQLANTYDISMRIVEFQKVLSKFDMLDVFTLRDSSASSSKNLLSLFSSTTEDEVRASNKFYMQFGQDYDLQNLHWSSELLENSCEQDLLDKISEKLISVPDCEKGGPLFFFYLMLEVTSSTTDAVRAMEHRVTSLRISSFEGENVSTVVSQLRSAISRLTFLNKLPHDIVPKLLEVFQSSSVPLFNDVFRFCDLQRKIGQKTQTASELLSLASSTYRELVEQGEWSGLKKKALLTTCFGCGKEGHIVRDCPTTVVEQTKDTRGWTRTPDPNGKEVLRKHDKDWFWCSKCSRCNLIHKTSAHVKKADSSSDSRAVIVKASSPPSSRDTTTTTNNDDVAPSILFLA